MYGQVYMCIDTKLFYVYVECVARGYDSFKVPLVVADPTRSDGAITLAIFHELKELDAKNRCRIFEIFHAMLRLLAELVLYMETSL